VKLAASQELYSYWNLLRGERCSPERNEIDPGVIRGVLADTFILEFDSPAGFPMRIAGARTNALFLRELRGAPFLEVWRSGDKIQIQTILDSVADDAQPFLLGATSGPPGFAVIDFELLLLPLRHYGATHARILGSLSPRTLPPWLGLLALAPLALGPLRALGPEDAAVGGGVHLHAGRQFFGRAPKTVRRGHLFVYDATKQ
jgi:hypothetical protein